ncbi:hypothetical protein Tco_0667930 [Tanacetum coccineum]
MRHPDHRLDISIVGTLLGHNDPPIAIVTNKQSAVSRLLPLAQDLTNPYLDCSSKDIREVTTAVLLLIGCGTYSNCVDDVVDINLCVNVLIRCNNVNIEYVKREVEIEDTLGERVDEIDKLAELIERIEADQHW